MKRRLNIACGLLHKPRLIIMDEPTVGVDVQSRSFILEFIKKLQKGGVSVLYTTHYMEEVEIIADRVIVINSGKIIANGSLSDIRNIISPKKKVLIEMEGHTGNLLPSLKELPVVKECDITEEGLSLTLDQNQPGDVYYEIIRRIHDDGGAIEEINTVRDNLETVFLNLTSGRAQP
jgi:ABC-2 type transport system ATP-binding protein